MSLILDALKRAERERRLKQAPDLTSVYEENHLPVRRVRPWFWLSAAALLAIAAILVGFVLWPDSPDSGRPDVQAGSSTRSAGPARPALAKAPAATGTEISQAQPQPPSARAPEAADPGAGVKTPSKSRPQTKRPPIFGPVEPDSHKEQANTDPADTPAAAATTPDQPANPPAPAADAQQTPPTTREANLFSKDPAVDPVPAPLPDAPEEAPPPPHPEELPLLSQLPTDVREKIGNVQINIHSYAKNPDERLIFINMKRLKAGDRITEEGPVLKEITPEGAIIDYGEGQVRVKVWP